MSGFVSIVQRGNLPDDVWGKMGESGRFCFVTGNAMIHAKRRRTSGLINHFFLGFLGGILFLFSSQTSPSPLLSALLIICWHSGMPHHADHSSLLICPVICLDGKKRKKEKREWDKNESDQGVEGDRKGREEETERRKFDEIRLHAV